MKKVTNYEYIEEELNSYKPEIIKKIAKKYGLEDTYSKKELIDNILDYQDSLLKASSKKYINKFVEPNRDWTKVAIRDSDNLYDYWIVPKNTLLYKGVDVAFGDDIVPQPPSFYADLIIASEYAFDNEARSRFGEYGKVITVITINDIRLLDLSSKKTLASLQKFKQPGIGLELVFGSPIEPRRYSNYDADGIISKWLCENNFSGFGYPRYAGFHNEIMICSNNDIERYHIEYRSINKLQCLFEISTRKGLLSVVPARLSSYNKNIRQIYASGEYKPEEKNIRKTDKYISEIRKKSESLCNPVISEYEELLSKTRKAVIDNNIDNIIEGLDKGVPTSYLIHTAINNEKKVSTNTIKLLVNEGANPNYLQNLVNLNEDIIKFAINHGSQPSIFIDNINDGKLLKLLLDNGADINRVSSKAVVLKDYNVLRESLDKGAHPYTTLEKSLDNEYYPGAELSTKYKLNIDGLLNKYTSIAKKKQLLFLLDRGADVGKALSNAIAYDNIEIIKLLANREINYSFLKSINQYYINKSLLFFLDYLGDKIPTSDLIDSKNKLLEIKNSFFDKKIIDKAISLIDDLLKSR